ncbi:hypothetical protein ABFS82_06G183500 [Erythranthe guttata]|nr:PREDICTED: NAC domain-containing protein 53-like [Erythranthe guttata]|eukprot:XP_012834785.1 PREDICTED: NAC domain-containing protein 53-like [Erythranthe guttata]
MGHEVAAAAGGGTVAAAATCLAPGFRFHPTDEELVRYYLRRKACRKPFRFEAVSEIDVYKSEPWEIAEYSSTKSRDLEWYFFSPVDRKYGNGSRLNRATGQGYWKATGKDRYVRHKDQTIGMKKTLVFHSGRAPDGKRTNWVMHEYRLCDSELEMAGVSQEAFVLCRIFQKSGLGPPNGNRYAPFVEEEWDDDDDMALVVPGGEPDDDVANGDEARVLDQETQPLRIAMGPATTTIPFTCKRERSDGPDPLTLSPTKRSKLEDPISNGSEDSTTTSQDPPPATTLNMMMTKKVVSLEFPLFEEPPNENNKFDSSNLEKSVPPGYLKFINNLEKEMMNVSMDRESLKIEVMRAQAIINYLQSRVDLLTRENEDLRKRV